MTPTFSAGRSLAPGIVLAALVAIVAILAEPVIARAIRGLSGFGYTLPAIVIALLLGVVLNGYAARPAFQPGLTWCVKKLLRIAIGLLGIRIALGDIVQLGLSTAALVVGSMAITLLSGLALARLLSLSDEYGALAGAATSVCGASATLATATALPEYRGKSADVAFTVVAANAVSTLVMVAYPPLCILLGLDPQSTGVLLGATIHDMAQVVGAGYAVSEPVGNTAVVVKLFRVFLLLPVVLLIGHWFAARAPTGAGEPRANVPVPVFALAFLALCLLNSAVPALADPQTLSAYGAFKGWIVQASTAGMIVAIAALGLGTSVTALLNIGWRYVLLFFGTTLVIVTVVITWLVIEG